jgi:hypothetical protein
MCMDRRREWACYHCMCVAEVETSITLSSVGVSTFALCPKGTEHIVLVLSVPSAAVLVRPFESDPSELAVTCRRPADLEASFQVVLRK